MNLTVDLSDGPNPIMTALLKRQPQDGYVRGLFGLGQAELIEPAQIVHDPEPMTVRSWPSTSLTNTILHGMVSSTPTGSINLKLRKV